MFAGLPGVGLGGLFYVLLVCWMPVRELWRLARGRSSLARWAFVGGQVGLVAGIVAALWAEAWTIRWLIEGVETAAGQGGALATVAGRHLPPALAWTPFVLLLLLVGGVHLARLVVRRHTAPAGRQTPPAAIRRLGEVVAAP